MQLIQNQSSVHQGQPDTSTPPFDRQRLIVETLALVSAIAGQFVRMYPYGTRRDDLVCSGRRGLLMAADSFDPTRGALFTTYAYIRIRGAMLDDMRSGRRSTRAERTQRSAIAGESTSSEGRPNGEANRLTRILGDCVVRLEEQSLDANAASNPEMAVDRAWTEKRVRSAIAALPGRERQVVELLYYQCDNSFKAVAEVLGVTRPHIFRIHARAVARMRGQLAELAGN